MFFYRGLALDLKGGKSTVKVQVFLPVFFSKTIQGIGRVKMIFYDKKNLLFSVVLIMKFWVFLILPKTQ